MKSFCPYCEVKETPSEFRHHIVRAGYFRRKSDSRRIQRFRCLGCRRSFSNATGHPCFGQNKRQFNERLRKQLCSGTSLRRAAKILHLSRTTVARKLVFLGQQARLQLEILNKQHSSVEIVEFDDLETFEHTKCKPLS